VSDKYHDVGLHWALLALVGVLATGAAWPPLIEGVARPFIGGWEEPSLRAVLTTMMLLAVAIFVAVLLLLKIMPLRLALTPGATKSRRVRRKAVELFKVGAAQKTVGRTGILVYLSMGEHRAEIVADEAILAVTTADTWAEAMDALLAEVKAGRPGEGICAAVTLIGSSVTSCPCGRRGTPDRCSHPHARTARPVRPTTPRRACVRRVASRGVRRAAARPRRRGP